MFQVVSAIISFSAGQLADRVSLRLLIASGVVVCAFGIGMMGFVSEPGTSPLLFGLIYGVGNAGWLAHGRGDGGRTFPGNAGFANGFVTSGMSLGQLLIVAVLAAVLVQIGWRLGLFLGGGGASGLLPLIYFAVPARLKAMVRWRREHRVRA